MLANIEEMLSSMAHFHLENDTGNDASRLLYSQTELNSGRRAPPHTIKETRCSFTRHIHTRTPATSSVKIDFFSSHRGCRSSHMAFHLCACNEIVIHCEMKCRVESHRQNAEA